MFGRCRARPTGHLPQVDDDLRVRGRDPRACRVAVPEPDAEGVGRQPQLLSGQVQGLELTTAWFNRRSEPLQWSVAEISSVVLTDGNFRWVRVRLYPLAAAHADLRDARVSVSH